MNIIVDLNYPIQDGTEVKFRSPVDCSQVTGLIVNYNGGSQEFMFADANGNNVGDIDHLFAEDVVVKVILDVTTSMAFVQNADTNAYIERTFVKSVNGATPDENGNVNVAGGGSADAVLYTPQTLTEEQQAQARANIGATPTFHETITVYLGDELIDTTRLPTLGTNWSGDYENGFHHTSGSTESLSFINHATDIDCDYILEFDTDYTGGEFVNVGFDGTYKILVYNGTSHIVLPLRATSTMLRFTPLSDREFTISNISLKKIQTQGTKKELEVASILSSNSVSNYGFWNVILGEDTMENAVGSTRCIAIGVAALSQLQGGHRNVAIGTFSMPALTGGEENIAIGADSMFSAETGDGNIAIGRGVMNNAKEPSKNIAIGFKALNCAVGSTPVSNIGIGTYTGNYLTTGENNLMLGNNAGYNITSGKRNICIGHTARGAKTGNYNLCIGDSSGYSDGVTQSVAIGFKAIATASHQVTIGKANDTIILGGRKLIFNDDGTVTWEAIT